MEILIIKDWILLIKLEWNTAQEKLLRFSRFKKGYKKRQKNINQS